MRLHKLLPEPRDFNYHVMINMYFDKCIHYDNIGIRHDVHCKFDGKEYEKDNIMAYYYGSPVTKC